MSDIELSESDAKIAQAILRKDKLLTAMADDRKLNGLEDLARLLRMVVQGPVKLAIQWNQAQLDGWRRANAGVVKIGEMAICKDIQLASVTADNEEFFENMYKARGCGNG